jgi:hypothetical protein
MAKQQTGTSETKSETKKGGLGAYLQKARNTKSTRIWFIILLIVIVIVLYFFGILKKGFAIGIGIILLAALGLQVFDYDLDLGTLWRTGSLEESRVQYTNDGVKLMGTCVKGSGSTKDYDLNCDNFTTQKEAQAKYDLCAEEVASYNVDQTASKIKSLDIYGLDGDNDGVVCEHLPD